MNADRNDPIDRVLEEVLASMVQGEPRRVSGPSVRQAAGESRRSSLPMWLAAAAVLIVVLGLVLRDRAPVTPATEARVSEPPAPVETRPTPRAEMIPAAGVARPAFTRRVPAQTTTEPVYEGLPGLSIASIDLPEPLRPARIDADPLQISLIEISPLAVSSLSDEPEHK